MSSASIPVSAGDGCARRTDSEAGGATLGTLDDYAFFRSFVAEQAANDPELAAALAQYQQHDPETNSTRRDSSDMVKPPAHVQLTATEVQTDTEQQHHAKPIPGTNSERLQQLAVKEFKQGVAGVEAAEANAQAVAAGDSAPAAEACRPAVPTRPSRGKLLRPDFTRREIRSLRRLFPMQSPALKSAAMLQGEYQLLDLLGRGAFGTAYKARHLASGNLVCIKTVESTSAGSQGPADVERQKSEVAVLAALKHPNIIRYHDCFSDGAKLHIVMEWADGGDVQGVISKHTKANTGLSEEQVLTYFVQIVAALAHIHGAGVMHRDLKASNIFLSSAGLVKLADFGIAKVLDAPGANSSNGSRVSSGAGGRISGSGAAASVAAALNSGPMAQSFVGTPNYLAPEMINCEPYNQKADVWACGCVLYEMAALRPAFKADRIPMVYRLIRRGRLPLLPSTYSPEFKSLLQRLMAKDPNDRPSSAELLHEDLLRPHLERYQQLLQHLGLELPPVPSPPTGTSTAGNSACGAVSSNGGVSAAVSGSGFNPRSCTTHGPGLNAEQTRKNQVDTGPVKHTVLQRELPLLGPTILQTRNDDVDAEVQFLSFSVPVVQGDKVIPPDDVTASTMQYTSRKYIAQPTDMQSPAEPPGHATAALLEGSNWRAANQGTACTPTQGSRILQQQSRQSLYSIGQDRIPGSQSFGCLFRFYMCGCLHKVPAANHSGNISPRSDIWRPSVTDAGMAGMEHQIHAASAKLGCDTIKEGHEACLTTASVLDLPSCPSDSATNCGLCTVLDVASASKEGKPCSEADAATEQPVTATADTVSGLLQQVTGQFLLPVGGLRQQQTLSTVVSINESDLSSLIGQISLGQLSEAANAATSRRVSRINSNNSLGSGGLLAAKGAVTVMSTSGSPHQDAKLLAGGLRPDSLDSMCTVGSSTSCCNEACRDSKYVQKPEANHRGMTMQHGKQRETQTNHSPLEDPHHVQPGTCHSHCSAWRSRAHEAAEQLQGVECSMLSTITEQSDCRTTPEFMSASNIQGPESGKETPCRPVASPRGLALTIAERDGPTAASQPPALTGSPVQMQQQPDATADDIDPTYSTTSDPGPIEALCRRQHKHEGTSTSLVTSTSSAALSDDCRLVCHQPGQRTVGTPHRNDPGAAHKTLREEQLMVLSRLQELRAARSALINHHSIPSKCDNTPAHCDPDTCGPDVVLESATGVSTAIVTEMHLEQLKMLLCIRQLQASLGASVRCNGSPAPGRMSAC